jgi:hypothetical protein
MSAVAQPVSSAGLTSIIATFRARIHFQNSGPIPPFRGVTLALTTPARSAAGRAALAATAALSRPPSPGRQPKTARPRRLPRPASALANARGARTRPTSQSSPWRDRPAAPRPPPGSCPDGCGAHCHRSARPPEQPVGQQQGAGNQRHAGQPHQHDSAWPIPHAPRWTVRAPTSPRLRPACSVMFILRNRPSTIISCPGSAVSQPSRALGGLQQPAGA